MATELRDLPKSTIIKFFDDEMVGAKGTFERVRVALEECEDVNCGEAQCEAAREIDAWIEDHSYSEGGSR